MKNLAELIAAGMSKGQHNELVTLHAQVLTTMYDKTNAYFNTITIGGYAAFFGLWSLLGAELSPLQRLLSGTLILLSVMLFVGFEILKAAIFHWQIRAMLRIAKAPYDPPLVQIQKRIADYEKGHQMMLAITVGIWKFIFPATILTGIGGGLVMLYAFAAKLMAI